jgi:hypothetical protein
MKKTYYHGTSADNLEKILKEGIQPIPCAQRIWNDSYPNCVYLWSNSHEDCEGNGFDYAADSGFMSFIKARDKRIIVFKIEMQDKYMDPDVSGINMYSMGAVQTDSVHKRYITEYWISEDLSVLLPVALNIYQSNDVAKIELTSLQRTAVKLLNEEAYIILSELPIKWENVKLKQSKLKVA